MSSILNMVGAARPAAPAPDFREEETRGIGRREEEKRLAEDKQRGAERLLGAERLSQTEAAECVKAADRVAPPRISDAPVVDQYVRGQEPEPIGLYRLTQDENGTRSIAFDDPEKPKDAEKAAGPEAAGKAPEKEPETVTGNTDKVDREIRKLKEKLASLKQQLARAADNPEEQKKLEKEISSLENELRTKDTDAYRRQHTDFS